MTETRLGDHAGSDATGDTSGDDATPDDGARPDDGATPDDGADGAGEPHRRWITRRRLAKWNRPRHPRDWRWAVSNVGRVLIATGVLLFGFVAYQLWGTNLETARAQRALAEEFDEMLAATPPPPPPPTVAPEPTAPPTTIAGEG